MKYQCSNLHCKNYDEHATKPCHDCQERERLTETPENRERQKRIDAWKRHKEHNRKEGEE